MESLLGDDDSDADSFSARLTLAMETGEFEQAFVSFGTAVAEDDATRAATLREGMGELALSVVMREVGSFSSARRPGTSLMKIRRRARRELATAAAATSAFVL